MNRTEQADRRSIPGPSWLPSCAASSVFVGCLVAVSVRVVFPDDSGEPAMLGLATALGLLAVVGIDAGQVLSALALLAADPSHGDE